jgi:galactitol-specific phosphotransferase system IIB component
MIDFTAKQLSWIVLTACGIGGTGYLTIDGKIKEVDTKMNIANVHQEVMNDKLAELAKQLGRIEDKLDRRK